MTTRAPSIEIIPETIGDILRNTKRGLRVPINQRSYAWKPEHVRDLYNDWQVARAQGRDEYFMGSMVVLGSTGGSTELYDGQQRIATSMIFVAAIRDYFVRVGDQKTAGLIQAESLLSEDRKTHRETPHFQLNAEDHEFFLKRILRPPDDPDRKGLKLDSLKESQRRIDAAAREAAERIKTITESLPESERANELHRWLDFIEESARVIWVQVADERTAFTIFETMNDRGLKLSAADLLKNYLYGIADKRRNEAIQKWQAMCAVLESIEDETSEIVDYIRCYWVTKHGPVRTTQLYDEIKNEITNETKAIALASELETRAQDYTALLTSSYPFWAPYGPGVKSYIETLHELGVTQLHPLLLAAIGKFNQKELTKLIHACVAWSVRCLIAGVPSGTLEGFYSRNALRITNGIAKNVADVRADMLQIIPNDVRFKAAVDTANVANEKLARIYLRVLQRQEDGEKEPYYLPNDGREMTLEHVMPSRPGKGWGHIKPEDAKANRNRLGNQALLIGSVNSKLGNAGFDEKRKALRTAAFSLTSSIADFKTWDLNSISQRQQRLADLAVRAWPI
ncbi:MAG TPA: DUF262 domain-containing HNH endonuclease family protein [Terriglobales bacterium]|nr:DUF262 domain-containing HNH endonuclease family protein [Terriglobales bacterium]